MSRIFALLLCLSLTAGAATWSGAISDSACGEFHKVDFKHDKHMRNRDCTLRRVKEGARYILVSHHKILAIQNQNFPSLADFAGKNVRLTGDLTPEGAILVSRIE